MPDSKISKWEKRKGLTLLEMIISIAVFVLLSAAFAGIFNQSVRVYRKQSNKNKAALKAQTAVSWVSRDISSAICIDEVDTDANSIKLRNPAWGSVEYHVVSGDLLHSELNPSNDYVISENVIDFDLNFFNSSNDATTTESQVKTVEINLTTSSKDQQFTLNTVAVPESTVLCWDYRRKITIHNEKVDGDLTDFPILVDTENLSSSLQITLEDMANGGHVGQSDGGDIYFTASDGTTKLDHEIERYDPSTGDLAAWVRVPFLQAAADTIIYIYYGNDAAGLPDQWNSAAVWDTNYLGVWHMAEAPSTNSDGECSPAGEVCDSTSNDNDGDSYNMESNDLVPAIIADGWDFDGSTEYVDVGDIDTDTAMTISLWIYNHRTDQGGVYTGLIQKGYAPSGGNSWSLLWHEDVTRMYFFVRRSDNSGYAYIKITTYNKPNEWHHIVAQFDNGNMTIFEDAVLKDSIVLGTNSMYPTDRSVHIAKDPYGGASQYWDGLIDEVRISNIARSAQWISTEYNNQSDPGTFMTFGAEEAF